MKILGLDIGTTGICGIVYDTQSKKVIQSVGRANKSFIDSVKPYERMQDVNIILTAVNEILSEIKEEISAIGVSGQMHGIIYTDKNGEAVSPLFTWQDARGSLPYTDGKTYAGYLGCFPGYGLATALYNEVNGLVPEGAENICTVGDYVAMKLCGRKTPLMHITNAASLGGFSVKDNRFVADNPLLPEVTKDFVIIGKTAHGVPVCCAVGDNQAGFIGSVPESDGVLLNIGTGAQVSYLVSEARELKQAELRPFDGKRCLAAGCSLCGGRAFAMLEKLCREIANTAGANIDSFYPFLDRVLESGGETELKADCRFCGTRNDPGITGGFSNLTENNFRLKDFALAVLDGMVKELYDMYDADGSPVCLVCSGNGIRKNPILLDIAQKYFGVQPKCTANEEEAALGAAFTAGTAAGIFENIDKARENIILV